MKHIYAAYRSKIYHWFYSDKYWYCTKKDSKKHPVGVGDTYDEAFLNMMDMVHENATSQAEDNSLKSEQ